MDDKQRNIDDALLMLKERFPSDNDYQLGKRATELGIMGNPNNIFVRKKRSNYLADRWEDLQRHNRELVTRDLVPLALKATKKALKDKELTEKDKFPYVKLTLDKEFGEDRSPPRQETTYNIDQVQVLINQGLDNDK